MPKFTIGEGENQQEVEITNEEIAEKFETSDDSALQKLFKKLGIKKVDSKKEDSKDEPKKEESKVSGVDPELKDILKKQNETIQAMNEKFEKYDKFMEDEKKSETQQKAEKLLNEAVQDGRIANGEVEDFKKKFEEKYKGDVDILEDVLKSRQVDEKLKKQAQENSKKPGSGNESGDSKKDKGDGGVATFKQSQLRDPKFFEENEEEIEKAYKAGQIIRDLDE